MTAKKTTSALLDRANDDTIVLDLNDLPDVPFGQHAQAAIEKYYKALLNELGLEYPRTHNLELLYSLLDKANESAPVDLHLFAKLTEYASDARYDDFEIAKALDRSDCKDMVFQVRDYVLTRIAQLSGQST